MFKFAFIFCFFCNLTLIVCSQEKANRSDLIKLIKNLNNKTKTGQFGFEISCDSKKCGRNLILLGVMDYDKPKNSWYVLLDPYILNMPLEGYIDEKHFIFNAVKGVVSISKDCFFKLDFNSNIESESIEDCISINANQKSNEFNIVFSELTETLGVPTESIDPNCIIVRGEEYNYSFSFLKDKLKSHLIYFKNNAETRFSLYLYYELKNITEVKNAVLKYLKYADDNKFLSIESSSVALIRYSLVILSTIRNKMIDNKEIDDWINENLKIKKNILIENYSKLRAQFLDYLFSEDGLAKWMDLIQFKEKWKSRLIDQ